MREQGDGRPSVLRPTRVIFCELFRDVHVNRKLMFVSICCDFAQVIERYCANAVRRDSDPCALLCVRLARQLVTQSFEITQISFRLAFNETLLPLIRLCL